MSASSYTVTHSVEYINFVQNTLGSVLTNVYIIHINLALAIIVLCPDPVDIDNGMVTSTGNFVGDTATYTCDPGFELIGDPTTTCTQVDGETALFLPPPPVCRRE